MELSEIIKIELPHLKYVINCLERQGLCAGALPEIYGTLKQAVEINENRSLKPKKGLVKKEERR